jgi:phosphotransferase system HPr (HPr) family protein
MDMMTSHISKKVTVINELGLHARPAAMVAQLALEAESNIWLIKSNRQAEASSIIDLLTLECPKGSEVGLRAENPSDMPIVERIAALFEKGFMEEQLQ